MAYAITKLSVTSVLSVVRNEYGHPSKHCYQRESASSADKKRLWLWRPSHDTLSRTVQTLTYSPLTYKIPERTRMSLSRTTPRTSPMKRELITKLHATLEKLVHKETATGTEFWLARDLQKVLGYVRWANFEKVIHKAIMSLRAGRLRRRRPLPAGRQDRRPRQIAAPTSATSPSPATPAT